MPKKVLEVGLSVRVGHGVVYLQMSQRQKTVDALSARGSSTLIAAEERTWIKVVAVYGPVLIIVSH